MRIAIVTHARDCQWMYTIHQNQNGKKWLQQSFNIWSIHTVERLVGLHSDTCIYPPIMYTTVIILNAIKMQYFLNSFKTNDSCLPSCIVKPKLVLEDCNCNFCRPRVNDLSIDCGTLFELKSLLKKSNRSLRKLYVYMYKVFWHKGTFQKPHIH